MKRIVTIQDISAVGKCSVTVALPIISAMGTECAVLPTAVLSTHTAFKGFTFHDLTPELTPIAEHWKKENITFDAIYTGYLGSFEQIDLVSHFFDDFKKESTVIVVDPAMADNGKLYPGFTPDFAKAMSKICAKSDLCLPNITEASFMLGMPYREDQDAQYVKELLIGLASLGAKCAALTGIRDEKGNIGAMAYHPDTGKFYSYFNEYLPASFHGTGDVFASCTVGAMMNGFDIDSSLAVAVDYTLESMKLTLAEKDHNWYGVNFEQAFPYLIRRIGK